MPTTVEIQESLRSAYAKDDPTLDEFGLYAADLRPFGPRFTEGISPGDAESPETRLHAYGYVHQGDHVFIAMGSEVTDTDNLTLEGSIEGRVIRGRWKHHELFGRRGDDEGSFVMTRVAPP